MNLDTSIRTPPRALHPLLRPSAHAHPRRARLLAAHRPKPRADIAEGGFMANPLGWVKCVWKRINTNRSLGLGAEMAFWLFLSLLPLAAVGGLLTAKIAAGSWSTTAPLLESLPLASREMISTELGKVAAWNGGKVGIGAGLMFVWLASSGIHSIFDGIELETDAPPRPWWKKRLLAVGTCVLLSMGVASLTLLGTGLGWLWTFAHGTALLSALRIESSAIGQIVRLVMGAAVSFGLVSGLYWIAVPRVARRSMPIVPGALVALGLQVALGFGYGFYIKQAGDGGAYQAGLATIGVTLMALYLFCLVLLVGIKVNQMILEHRQAPGSAPGGGHRPPPALRTPA
jgi:membrane protein